MHNPVQYVQVHSCLEAVGKDIDIKEIMLKFEEKYESKKPALEVDEKKLID